MDLVNPIVRRWLREGEEDPVGFWARQAAALPWIRRWDRPFVSEHPSFRWFAGGLTNLSWAALDHHVEAGRGGHAALVYANERGARRVLTYAQLLHEVTRAAAALRGMGIGKGDRITLYLPTCPEAIVLMLAAVRIGAIHNAVFAGFGEKALGDRILASGSRAVFTADVTWRKGKETRLKEIVDRALALSGAPVEQVVVLRRGDDPPSLEGGRDLWWRDFLALAGGHSGAPQEMEANEPGLHPRHLRHHRATEARGPRARRVRGARPRDGPDLLRPAPLRRLVGDLGHRLGGGAQLRRLRAAPRGLHDRGVRGGDRPPRPGDALAPGRGAAA